MNVCMSWIALALKWSELALTQVIYAAAWASLLAAVVLVVDVLLRRRLSSRS